MSSPDWSPFFTELACKILEFTDDRAQLLKVLTDVHTHAGLSVPTLWKGEGTPSNIDPFSFFGTFNRGISVDKRSRILRALKEILGLQSPLPTSFAGIPLLLNHNANYYPFDSRAYPQIDALWQLANTAKEFVQSPTDQHRSEFIDAYDKAVVLPYIGFKLTIGLFWMFSNTFLTLDGTLREFVSAIDYLPEPTKALIRLEHLHHESPKASDYLQICEATIAALPAGKTLVNLSDDVWEAKSEKQKKEKENKKANAGQDTPKQWILKAGRDGSSWPIFQEQGIAAIEWPEVGDLTEYSSKDEVNRALHEIHGTSQPMNAHALWEFAHIIRPGDTIYACQGQFTVLGQGTVTGNYEYKPEDDQLPHQIPVEWLDNTSFTTANALPIKTLTEARTIPVPVDTPSSPEQTPYTDADFLAEAYLSAEELHTLQQVLVNRKNVILQGPPGTGKTFIARRLAWTLTGRCEDALTAVQFHPTLSYTDFVEGFRPISGEFKLVKGIFRQACEKAAQHPDSPHILLIDEINRGNTASIFGELLSLIEADKRGAENSVTLLYSQETFYVPENLLIIGTMNSADRSLAMLDFALRRRFSFVDIDPKFASDKFQQEIAQLNSPRLSRLIDCIQDLNSAITEDESLGRGFCVGHSYVSGLTADNIDDRLPSIVNYELIPLLSEYFYDDPARLQYWSDQLHTAIA